MTTGKPAITDYDRHVRSSPERARMVRQEEMILKLTQILWEALKARGISQAELARKLGKSESFVSQVLIGSRNMTLRTLSDFLVVLQCDLEFQLRDEAESKVRPNVQPRTRTSLPPGTNWTTPRR